eukprot:635708_1
MSDNGEDVYEVEAIIQDAFDTATMSRLYYVKWLGYDETENTWQNQSSLQHLEIFEAYETKRKPILTKPKATLSTLSMSRLYYVKWLGYDETENTWQNQSSLQHLEIFEAYETKRKPILTKPKATLSTLSNGKEDGMVAVSKAKRKTLSNGKEDD